ncbi:hypothetical protein PENTCL1PPCAC_18182, partial [Pristionchus entomophagus]
SLSNEPCSPPCLHSSGSFPLFWPLCRPQDNHGNRTRNCTQEGEPQACRLEPVQVLRVPPLQQEQLLRSRAPNGVSSRSSADEQETRRLPRIQEGLNGVVIRK